MKNKNFALFSIYFKIYVQNISKFFNVILVEKHFLYKKKHIFIKCLTLKLLATVKRIYMVVFDVKKNEKLK